MGVQGLLPALRDVTRPVHVREYRGQAVAVDAYCWLHRGSYSCAREMCEGLPTDGYISFVMDRVRVLQAAGVTPILVFDGGRLPAKAGEEGSRQRNRADNLARARAHAAAGNAGAALDCYRRAVDVTPGHARRALAAAAAAGVRCVVAPYEADAQMAYLARTGAVAAVVTEDSDLLPYGAPAVLFKLDRDGSAQRVRLADVPAARNPRLAGFDAAMFIELCAMSGCDFVESLPSVGVKTAARLLARHRCAARAVRALRLAGKPVPADYEARLARAVATYRHQRVWCAAARRIVHLTPLPADGLPTALAALGAVTPDDDGTHFLGPPLSADIAAGVAEGRLDPMTRRPYEALPPVPPPRAAGGGRGTTALPVPPPPPPHPQRTLAGTLASMWRRAGAAGSARPPPPPPAATTTAITGVKRPAPGVRAALHADGAASQPPAAGGGSAPPSQLSLPSSAPALLESGAAVGDDDNDDIADLEAAMAAERAAAHATPARGGGGETRSPTWPGGATPAGWRDFYGDTPPASTAKADAANPGRRSAHFAPSPEEEKVAPPPPPPPPARRTVVAGLFGGLSHVNRGAAAARSAVGGGGGGGGDSGDENVGAGGGGGKRAKRNAFARFAFNANN